jgi:hypothetical protein
LLINLYKRVFGKSAYSAKTNDCSPLAPRRKRGKTKKAPLSKGDLGGSKLLKHALRHFTKIL